MLDDLLSLFAAAAAGQSATAHRRLSERLSPVRSLTPIVTVVVRVCVSTLVASREDRTGHETRKLENHLVHWR